MRTLEQDRASLAHDHVSEFEPQSAPAKKYGTMVHKMPSLLMSAGLCQSIHYVASRGDDHQKRLLDHLATQLQRVDGGIGDRETLLDRVRQAELPLYLRLTHEALACASWYRRMVQGVLKVEPGEEGEEEQPE